MKKVLLAIVAAVLGLFFQCESYGVDFELRNNTDQPLLVEFHEALSERYSTHQMRRIEPGGFQNLDYEVLSGEEDIPRAFFYLFDDGHVNSKAFCRVYTADTVLLKEWTLDYNTDSHERQFFRESDWLRNQYGDLGIEVHYVFNLFDEDLTASDQDRK